MSGLRESKRLDTGAEILAVFTDRWSPRSFASRMPEPEKLRTMFEAARLAPSAHNTQPARFLVALKGRGDDYDRLYSCLSDGNKEWAHTAPVLVLAAAMRQRFSQKDAAFVPYPHSMHDLGLAVMSAILQARAVGLDCHPMAGFDPDRASVLFDIPPLFEPGVVIAVGYLGSPDALAEPLRERELAPRTRRSLVELVFEDRWGTGSSLFQ
jgi:Nitroreductase